MDDSGEELADERFKLLLDTLPHPAFALSADGLAQHYNQAFIAFVGHVPGPGKDARLLLHHPEDRSLFATARAAVQAGRGEWVIEARMRRHDGAYRWHRIHNKPMLKDGVPIGYIGTAVDIHDVREANEELEHRVRERTAALQQSEQRYRMLYNRTPMALHSVDSQARLLDVNDTWTDLFGWKREHVLGRSPAEFMTEASAARYRDQTWPTMLSSAGETRTAEYQFVCRNGRVFDGRLAARGEFDDQGRFIRSWSAIADVSAEKQAERDLLQAQRMEAVGQLTAGIAHDFNNLLTAILGSLELLARQSDMTGRAGRLIAGARDAASRGARLTSQLLAFSRQQPITPQPVDVNFLLEAMHPLLQSSIGATVRIELELRPELELALADPTQLELAVLNLAINARDAMGQGGVLTIGTSVAWRDPPTRSEEPEAGVYVCISVADNGPGIPAAVRARMFEPFFTTKQFGKGSGLGLPQALGLLKQLGGGVVVHSEPGKGARLDLLLPRAGTSPLVPPAGEDRNAIGGSVRRLDVMVVDDDPAVREVAVEMLRACGHDVVEHGSGVDALAGLESRRPDLLLCDLAMPEMNGVEFAAAARKRWPGLPIVFMTGYAEEKLLGPARAEDVIRKPFKAEELIARVSAAVTGNPASGP